MLELRAAYSATYERRSVFVTTYLAYQSAAVHPRGAFALWSDRATTARLYSLIDNLVRRSPGLCDATHHHAAAWKAGLPLHADA